MERVASDQELLRQQDRDHVWHPLTQHAAYAAGGGAPLVIRRGHGAVVEDVDGRTYLDTAAGLWCVNVGYGREELVEAASAQMRELPYFPLTQSHPVAIRLADKLAELLPHNPHIYFSNSGSEANETAFKLVRQYWRNRGRPRKWKVISRYRGYHGSTLGALAATGQPERKRDYEPLAEGFIQVTAPYCYRCPFGLTYPSCQLQCAQDFARRIEIEDPETVAAVIVEPVGAGGGVLVPPEDYLAKVREITLRYDVKLIVDEVVTGFGRTGSMFAHPDYGVQADVVTMAKGFTSGYLPMGATAVSQEIFEAFLDSPESGRHFRSVNTYSGHPVAAAVALRNIQILEDEGLAARARELGAYFLAALARLRSLEVVGDVRGRGLLDGVELVASRQHKEPLPMAEVRQVVAGLAQRGILVGKTTDVVRGADSILMFAPPLVIERPQLDRVVDALEEVLGALVEGRRRAAS